MEYQKALKIAEKVKALLKPYCQRVEIAGSIRRKKNEVKDIEIVAIPKSYNTGLFENGIATIVNQWPKVKGELPCKYTQRILPEGIKLDLFFAEQGNWGLIFAIRTGCAEYSHKILATNWVKKGYKSEGGFLFTNSRLLTYGRQIAIREEEDLFKLIGVKYIEPEFRK